MELKISVKKNRTGSPLPSIFKLDERRSPTGNCWGFEDGLDGFDIHTDECTLAGWSWTHGSACINHTTWRGVWPEWAKKE